MRQDEIHRSVISVFTRGSDHFFRQFVITTVTCELIFQPYSHFFVVFTFAECTGSSQKPVGEVIGPMAWVIFACKKIFNNLRSSAGLRIAHVLGDFFGAGNSAHNIQAYSANKFIIIDEPGRYNFVFFPRSVELLIDRFNYLLGDLFFFRSLAHDCQFWKGWIRRQRS